MKLNTSIEETTETEEGKASTVLPTEAPETDKKSPASALKKSLIDAVVEGDKAVRSAEKASEKTYTVLYCIDREMRNGSLTKSGIADATTEVLDENAAISNRLIFPGEGPADKRTFTLPASRSGAAYWAATAQIVGKSGSDELELPVIFRTVRDACNKWSLTKEVDAIVEEPHSTAKEAIKAIKDAIKIKQDEDKQLKAIKDLVPTGSWDDSILSLLRGEEVKGYHSLSSFDTAGLESALRALEYRVGRIKKAITKKEEDAKAAADASSTS